MTGHDHDPSEQSDHTDRLHHLRHERVAELKAASAADLAIEWVDIPAALRLVLPVLYGSNWDGGPSDLEHKVLAIGEAHRDWAYFAERQRHREVYFQGAENWLYKADLVEQRKGGLYVQTALLQEELKKIEQHSKSEIEMAVRYRLKEGAPDPSAEAPEANEEPASGKIERLAEWIFEKRPANHQRPETKDNLYNLALAARPIDSFTSIEFTEAYQRVYESQRYRQPRTGWPLREPFKSRAADQAATRK